MKKILLFFVCILVLSGCSNNKINNLIKSNNSGTMPKKQEEIIKYNFREISEEEIKKFIPINYSTVKEKFSGSIVIRRVGNYYLLPLSSNGEMLAEDNAKIIILGFDDKEDTYKKINEYKGPGDTIEFFYQQNLTELNGHNEFFASFRTSGASAYGYKLIILSFANNNLIEIGNIDMYTSDYFSYNSVAKNILVANYIWQDGEPHFGCHYFNISKYILKNDVMTEEKKTKTKYQYDTDGYQYDNVKCFKFLGNINDLLRKESINI